MCIKYKGILIIGNFICFECEREIVKVSCDDTKYKHYKKIWKSL
ncbi:sigma factor G inhibitor Gin [Peptococcaceae bacterium]|nr:sigma factor G inhibitor Gin [Peptococcaceae bacterium]